LEIDRARLCMATELDRIAEDLWVAKIKEHYSC